MNKVDPKNGATKVDRSKKIKLTFNKDIKAGNCKIMLKNSKGKSVKISKFIKGKVLIINHAKLAENSKYRLYIHAGSVTDKIGNSVTAKTTSFTTGIT